VRSRKTPPPEATGPKTSTRTDLFDAAAPSAPARAQAELRFGQLGIAQLRLHALDPALVFAAVDARVKAAPQLFTAAPVVLDFAALAAVPDAPAVRSLIEAVQGAGLHPVGIAAGSDALAALARELALPLFAKFREREAGAPEPIAVAPAPAPIVPVEAVVVPAPVAPTRAPGQHHAEPVRSGQRLYARGTDLTVAAVVGHGAEVIADGSIHLYGVLRGRALAGAQGDASARIYCQNFQAELIAIAGCYRVFEEPAPELHGRAVQAWLEGDNLRVAALN
jgi:septum site-determining protein MinC